jgi:hypothetical protein
LEIIEKDKEFFNKLNKGGAPCAPYKAKQTGASEEK